MDIKSWIPLMSDFWCLPSVFYSEIRLPNLYQLMARGGRGQGGQIYSKTSPRPLTATNEGNQWRRPFTATFANNRRTIFFFTSIISVNGFYVPCKQIYYQVATKGYESRASHNHMITFIFCHNLELKIGHHHALLSVTTIGLLTID